MGRNGKSNTLIKTFRNDNITEVKQKNAETGQGAGNAGKNPVAGGLETTHSRFSSMGRKRLRSQTERTATGAKTHDIDFVICGVSWRGLGGRTSGHAALRRSGNGGDDSADVMQASPPTETSVEPSTPATQASPLPTETSVEISAFDEGDMVGGIGASQIDSSTQLSQGTLNDLFSSSSNSEVELSQTAVARAFNLSLSEIADHQDAATSVQLLSEGSGLETDAEADHETTASSERADKPRRDCT
ncbi:unnamed protein product [Phytophthora fragariaefolia]|uniref:Unnamed protein product n=1 Tax=Phytophthora fragariaefolia TaxID=1490495 RepID=A0A9W6Y459_9STRA|nr:unnamed protein product [Phytophthora fragariaefolia]